MHTTRCTLSARARHPHEGHGGHGRHLAHWFVWHRRPSPLEGKEGVVPRGTYPREDKRGGRLIRTFPPHQQSQLDGRPAAVPGPRRAVPTDQSQKSMAGDDNLKLGSMLVPQFPEPGVSVGKLAGTSAQPGSSRSRRDARRRRGRPRPGRRRLQAQRTRVAKKIGMVGYDRRTRAEGRDRRPVEHDLHDPGDARPAAAVDRRRRLDRDRHPREGQR